MIVWKEESDAIQLREIRKEFANLNEKNWQTFARECWPDIDKAFDLEAIHKQRNLPPSPPWARSQPSKGVHPPRKKC